MQHWQLWLQPAAASSAASHSCHTPTAMLLHQRGIPMRSPQRGRITGQQYRAVRPSKPCSMLVALLLLLLSRMVWWRVTPSPCRSRLVYCLSLSVSLCLDLYLDPAYYLPLSVFLSLRLSLCLPPCDLCLCVSGSCFMHSTCIRVSAYIVAFVGACVSVCTRVQFCE